MATLSSHVLDTALGKPAQGMEIALASAGEVIGRGTTNADGRVTGLGPAELAPGDYVITFGTGAYHRSTGQDAFYPTVSIEFTVAGSGGHYHVPLIVSPFGYTTYRGS